MGNKQRQAGGWALTLMASQLEQSEEHNRRLRLTSDSIQTVVSFYSAQNSSLRDQLFAVEEELHTVRQKLAAYEEREDAGLDVQPLEIVTSESGVHRSPLGRLLEEEEAFDDDEDEDEDENLRVTKEFNDLTLIAGVDDMTAQLLNALGIFSFRQIANFDAESWAHLAAFIPALESSVERIRWRHEAEALCRDSIVPARPVGKAG